jgi:hypothetical protein
VSTSKAYSLALQSGTASKRWSTTNFTPQWNKPRREKQIKGWQRAWKVRLIMTKNPQWIDLFDEATNALLEFPADHPLLQR